MTDKRTKIVATISDKRCDALFIRSLWEAGMNAVRINTAHVTTQSADRIITNVREVSDSIAIIVDTKGPEIRVTGMVPENADGIPVVSGSVINVRGTGEGLPSSASVLYVNDPDVYDQVPLGASLLIDDGEIELKVKGKMGDVLQCEALNSGVIKPHKSVNVPGVPIDLPSVTDRDREFILWAIERDLDFIAHSFVRKKEDVMEVKKILKAHKSPIKIISKIENREGIDNLDDILTETYGVMVARGDLGVEIPAEELPVAQRMIVKKCIESKTPVIIATQMLHTMITNPRPTRAEVSDIAGAIYQRVDAIMLSGETANGLYPIEAVRTMTRVAIEIERDNDHNTPLIDLNMVHVNNEITAQLARSAVSACINLPVKGILIDTLTGRTARYIAAFRGTKPLYAVCYNKTSMRLLAISYGVHAVYQLQAKDQYEFMLRTLQNDDFRELANNDDLIVVVGGNFGMAQGASFMEINTVADLEQRSIERSRYTGP